MREVAHSVITTVSSGHNVEGLERKLIALRAEIDAILSLLAAGKITAPAPAIELEPAAELKASETCEVAPIASDLAPTEETGASAGASGEADGRDPRNTCEVRNAEHDGVPPTHPAHAVTPAETAPEVSIEEIPASAAIMPSDLADRPEVVVDATSQVTDTLEMQMARSQAEMPIELAAETLAPSQPTAAMEALPSQPAPAEPAVAAAAQPPAEAPLAQTAAVEVIGLHPRLREPTRDRAAALAPPRPRRRLAAKIAASIIALLAAGAVLILADEEAIGSAPSLPWMSPQPAKSGSTWPSLVGRLGLELETTAVDENSRDATRTGGGDALLLRYREVWPLGW